VLTHLLIYFSGSSLINHFYSKIHKLIQKKNFKINTFILAIAGSHIYIVCHEF